MLENSELNERLLVSAEKGNLEGVVWCLEQGADVNTENEYHLTPLFQAVSENQLKVVEHLLGEGAQHDIVTDSNNSALRRAAELGYTDCAKLLIEKGANVNGEKPRDFNNAYSRPLHLAARSGSLDTVNLLLDHGAQVDKRNYMGETPLHCAATGEIAEVLINAGADVNVEAVFRVTEENFTMRCTPLHSAVSENRESTVKMLIARGAELDRKNDDDRTALQLAVNNLRLPINQSEQESCFKISQILIKETCLKNRDGEAATDCFSDVSAEDFQLHEKFSKVWDTCGKEIKQLSKEIPNSPYLVNDLCEAKDYQLEKICRHEAVQAFQFQNLEQEYPDFASKLKTQLSEGLDRKTAADKTVSYMTVSENKIEKNKPVLDENCLREIFQYLPSEQLKSLSSPPQTTQDQQKNLSLQSAMPSLEEKKNGLAQSKEVKQSSSTSTSYGGARPKDIARFQDSHSRDPAKKDSSTLKKQEEIAEATALLKEEGTSQFKERANNIATSSTVMQSPFSSGLFVYSERAKDESTNKDQEAEKKKLEERRLKH